jgi:hypothetical protein
MTFTPTLDYSEKHSDVVFCAKLGNARLSYTSIMNDVAPLLKQRSDQVRWRAEHTVRFN